jgi:hypothetical protein
VTTALTIAEHIDDAGRSITTALSVEDEGCVSLHVGGERVADLTPEVVVRVMARYARELECPLADAGAPRLDLGDGRALRMLRHRARYDVIARDFLVLERAGAPAIAELSTAIAAALRHLVEAARPSENGPGGKA